MVEINKTNLKEIIKATLFVSGEGVALSDMAEKFGFEIKDIKPLIKTAAKEDMIFIKKEFLEPYLEFVKKNKRVLKMIHKRPVLFKSEKIYSQMSEELFFPILSKFGVPKEEQVFKLEFFTRGTAGIIDKWLMLDCEVPTPKIMEIVIDCINFSKNNI